jgi:VIT1/CCC1 family predicted Fe2+/Mn2+ transporter
MAPTVPAAARADLKRVAVFGSVDGLGLYLGIVAGLIVAHQQPSAVWVAAVSGGTAELISMANAQRLSDRKSGVTAALVVGAASFAGCVTPAVPYAAWHGPWALTASLLLAVVVAGVISWLRPEKGVLAVVETYALLAVTAVACGLLGLWLR